MRLTLLVRAYCHLCDEMAEALRPIASAAGASVEMVDVDAPGNEELEAAWGDRVPALFAGPPAERTLLCATRLDPGCLASALGGAAPPPAGR